MHTDAFEDILFTSILSEETSEVWNIPRPSLNGAQRAERASLPSSCLHCQPV